MVTLCQPSHKTSFDNGFNWYHGKHSTVLSHLFVGGTPRARILLFDMATTSSRLWQAHLLPCILDSLILCCLLILQNGRPLHSRKEMFRRWPSGCGCRELVLSRVPSRRPPNQSCVPILHHVRDRVSQSLARECLLSIYRERCVMNACSWARYNLTSTVPDVSFSLSAMPIMTRIATSVGFLEKST